jgi:shikimate kinase
VNASARGRGEDEDQLRGHTHPESREGYLARHIALIGFMGAGKSTLGPALAREMERPYFDTDHEVESRLGRTIVDLFAGGEEATFRRVEAEVVNDLVRRPPAVISLGGGALHDSGTRATLFDGCFVVHLFVSWADVRLALPTLVANRPLLQGRSESDIHELYLKRQWTYQNAHLRIDAPRGDVTAAAKRVLSQLTSGGPGPGRHPG